MSDFARKQLEKYGWSEGKGLGKEESGIVNPIKTKLKFDKQGIGHDNVKQWTSAWWCDMFNDAAKRINVKNSEAGVNVSSEKRIVESNILSPVLIHKNFVKSETIVDSSVLSKNSSEQPEEKISVISDSIFRMCEGTKKSCDNYSLMKGKINRVRRQEALFEEDYKRKMNSKSKKKKKKKQNEKPY